jgi:CheY-like chemotaxis protein
MKTRRCAKCNVTSACPALSLAVASDGAPGAAAQAEALLDGVYFACPSCAAPSNEVGLELTKTASAEPSIDVRSWRRNLRVLLVDDEHVVRRSTARCLAGFDIVTASSGAEALAILSNDRDFDAVLSDVMMPGMSGPELFERCCEQYSDLARRFVFASGDPGSARPHLLRAVERAGAEHVPVLLPKPSSREALLGALFAVSAPDSPRSGTWLIAEPLAKVKRYRG